MVVHELRELTQINRLGMNRMNGMTGMKRFTQITQITQICTYKRWGAISAGFVGIQSPPLSELSSPVEWLANRFTYCRTIKYGHE